MKLTVLLLLIFLQVRSEGLSQSVTLELKDASLFQAFKEITKQTQIAFIYDEAVTKRSLPISISIKNATILQAIEKCLDKQPLSYRMLNDKTVLISIKEPNKAEGEKQQQSDTTKKLFRGKVLNTRGEPLTGATILLKALNKGTQTDASGEFSFDLTDVEIAETISISYTGFKAENVKPKGNTIVIYLEQSVTELDKVIIQGYGTTTQRYTTSNIATISSEEIERQPVANPLQALQGKVAGLNITQTSGFSSAPFKVEIRGRQSINAEFPSDPLYIVDGVPLTVLNQSSGSGNYESGSTGFVQNGFQTPAKGQSPLFSIDPDEIESISVLKDADATAIYGSRGGRGVILIQTKRGAPGKTTIDGNISTGWSFVSSYYDMLNTAEYVEMRKEAFRNSNITPTTVNAYDIKIWDTTRQTDWQKYFWGKAATTNNANLSISGGDKNMNFRVSGGYQRFTSVNSLSGADERSSLQFNLGHKSNDNRFELQLTGMYTFTKVNNLSLKGNILSPPTAPPVFDQSGKLNYAGWAPVSHLFSFGYLLQPYIGKTRFLNSNIKLYYTILKGLKASISLGYSTQNMSQRSAIPIVSQNPKNNPLGSATFGNNSGSRTIIEPSIEYKSYLWKGEFTTIIGSTYQQALQENTLTYGSGYINDNLLGSIANAPVISSNDGYSQYKYAALFSRLSYNILNKYIISLSGRRDGSSRFGPGKQYGNFGALGLAWIFSEEKLFIDKIKFISYAKLRFNYGVTGSDNIGDYNYLTRWSGATSTYQRLIAYVPQGHSNPDLQWQSDKKLEVGLHLGFLKDRILFNISWYRNRSDNQLLRLILPSNTGFEDVVANFPANVQNTGWEPGVTLNVIKRKDVQFTINAVAGINRNKLVSFPGIEKTPYAETYVIGKPLTMRKLLTLKGVDPSTGHYQYEDVNKDGKINTSPGPEDDRKFKDLTIAYDGGVGLELRVKTVEFGATFGFRKQTGKNALYLGQWPGVASNIPRELLKRWQKPGDITPYARYTVVADESDRNFSYSDGQYTNASFIRLNNISLAYSIPKELQRRIKTQAIKIYLRGQNLFLITKYKGSDPETQAFGIMPPLTTITFGAQVKL